MRGSPFSGTAGEAPVVIFVGGFGDRVVHRVSGFAFGRGGFAQAHPGLAVACFAWPERDRILAFIRQQPPGRRLRLAGHSFGGDAAAHVAVRLGAEGRPVDLLATADPVSRGTRPDFAGVRRAARRWINVNATGGGPLEPSNVVARIGGAWRHAPRPFAHDSLDQPVRHADFAGLMAARLGDGRTVAEALAGP